MNASWEKPAPIGSVGPTSMYGASYRRIHPCVENVGFGNEFFSAAFWAAADAWTLKFGVDGHPLLVG